MESGAACRWMSLTPRSSSSASGESEFSAAENIGVCACDGNTPESSTAPPAITELRIKLRRDRSCLFFIVSSVIQFDNTYFLQPRDNPFISCVIRSPTNLYALQYSRLRAKGTDKPVACLGRAGPARAERNDSSSREVMCCEERADGEVRQFPPR